MFSILPELAAGQRHEHVLERGRVRGELRQLELALGEKAEQRKLELAHSPHTRPRCFVSLTAGGS